MTPINTLILTEEKVTLTIILSVAKRRQEDFDKFIKLKE